MRNYIMALLAAVAVIVPLTTIASAAPVHHARSSVLVTHDHLFETFNSSIYVTTDGTALYSTAETGSSPGRDLTITDTGFKDTTDSPLCTQNSPCEVYQLVTNLGFCLGVNNAETKVEIRDCSPHSGGQTSATNWARPGSSFDNTYWLNTLQSLDEFNSSVLNGGASSGQVIIACDPFAGGTCAAGTYSKWSDAIG